MNFLKKHLAPLVRFNNHTWNNKNFLGSLNIPHENLDKDLQIKMAAAWLCRAQDVGTDRGISWGISFNRHSLPSNGCFLLSYPETTGYIIPTFIRLSHYFKDESYMKRAVMMGDWLLGIQMGNGAIRGGLEDGSPPKPVVFTCERGGSYGKLLSFN